MSYLIENQVIEGFTLASEDPVIYLANTEVLVALEVGQTYTVTWDGTEYTCTAVDVSSYGNPGDVALGDVNYAFGGESTGEPFAIGYGQGYMDGVAQGVFGNTWFSKTAESSHTVSVALYVEPEEEQEGIVLKDRNGDDVAYYGIETVTFDTTTEGKQQTYSKGVVAEGVEVTLALAGGDQVIQAPDGYLVKEATIKKPETLLPENIANGVEIAGVTGTFEGNLLEDVPIELDFSAGDQTVTAPDGYGVKSAIIAKPENLKPDNIREGETVAGIPGAFAGGSPQSKAINFYDIYGNIVYSYTRAQAATLTELPEVPAIDGYEAAGWSKTLSEVTGCEVFLDIVPTYTKDGVKVGFLVLEIRAGDVIGIRTYVSSSGVTGTIYWGDGSSDSLSYTNTNTTTTTNHTYTEEGVYVVGIAGTDSIYLGNYTSSVSSSNAAAARGVSVNNTTSNASRVKTAFFNRLGAGNGALAYERQLTLVYFSGTIKDYSCYYCGRLRTAVMNPNSTWSAYAFYQCVSLERITGGSSSSLIFSGVEINDIWSSKSWSFFNGSYPKRLIFTSSSVVDKEWTAVGRTNLRGIYVPDDLVETYKSSYSTYSSNFKPLSEYPDY